MILFYFYPILDYYKIRTRTNFENPNGKSLDVHLIINVIYAKRIISRLNGIYSGYFQNTPSIKTLFGYVGFKRFKMFCQMLNWNLPCNVLIHWWVKKSGTSPLQNLAVHTTCRHSTKVEVYLMKNKKILIEYNKTLVFYVSFLKVLSQYWSWFRSEYNFCSDYFNKIENLNKKGNNA